MSDQVTIVWTDTTGEYSNSFLIESPTLADMKKAMTMPMGMLPSPDAKTETDAEFYVRISTQMVNSVVYQTQQMRQQQAMNMVPPINVVHVSAVTKDE